MNSTAIDIAAFVKQKTKVPILHKNVYYETPKEFAERMRMHPVTLYGLLKGNGVEGAIKVKGRWKIPVYKE